MAKLTNGRGTAYRDMLARLLPPGPLWRIEGQPELKAILTGLATELVRFHNRMIDAIDESDPRTADELLPEWLAAWGLPGPCGELPAATADQRAALAAKVAAVGGQSGAYYIDIVRQAARPFISTLVDTESLAYITVRPYGRPFRCGEGRCGDPLNGEGSMFYWRIYAAADTPADIQSFLECLFARIKPARTILEWSWTLSYKV